VNDHYDNQKLLRVAIIHTSLHKPEELKNKLKAYNIDVVAITELSNRSLCEIDANSTDVILVDLHENVGQELDVLENLLEESALPLLFNDSGTTQFNLSISGADWGKKLALKLRALVEKSSGNIRSSAEQSTVSVKNDIPKIIPATTIPKPIVSSQKQTIAKPHKGAEQVWVLGASLGGPLAARVFLSCLPTDLPIAFVLVQHIGASHITLLSEQLDRATQLKVMTAKEGHTLCDNEVVVAPIEKRIVINDRGEIVLAPILHHSIYSPSIDEVMTDIAEKYHALSGAIVFSGMGNDGEEGSKVIGEHGGVVWAQDSESCVISSMPDCARRTGYVSYSDTPEGLANNLVKYLAQN